MQSRVVRVGGSLLIWDQLVPTLRRWLDNQPPARNVLVCGGGPWVESLRQAAVRFDISEATAHWICIRALSTTAELLSALLNVPLITDFDALVETEANAVVFDVHSFLKADGAAADQALPSSWSVTSDTIAARLTERLGAVELVLVKSGDPPATIIERTELALSGYVDEFFPRASQSIEHVRYVNLRSY